MQNFTYYLKIILTWLYLLHMINSGSPFLLWWVPKFVEIKEKLIFQKFQKFMKIKEKHIDITRWPRPKSEDYIFCSQRWRSSIQSAKTRLGPDCGSVHELLIAKFRLKLKKLGKTTRPFGSVQFSHSVLSDSLWPHESQHARPPCPSPPPGVHSDSRPLSQWCHPAISSSVVPFSSCHQSLLASESSNESTLCMRWPKYWRLL